MSEWNPDWTVAPGETLRDWMDENHVSVRVTATACARMPVEMLTRILYGEEPITEEVAKALAHGTGIPARIWLNMEEAFRAGLAAGKSWERPDYETGFAGADDRDDDERSTCTK